MNPISWVILSIIILAVGIALFFTFKNKGKGCSCCGKNCPMKRITKDAKNLKT